MSVRVMNWVFEHSRSKKNARLALLAIADCANDAGTNAFPSTAELMRKTGLSERGVQGAVRACVELGELAVDANAGPRGCNRYRVIMTPAESAPPPQEMPPADSAGVQIEEGQVNGHTPANPAAPAESAPPQKTTGTPAESAPGTIKEPSVKTSSSKKSSKRAPRATDGNGTRLPEPFPVTDTMRTWARTNTPHCGPTDHDAFCDYWRAQPGAKGRKADWEATWRNWMRRAQNEAGRRQPRASPGTDLALNGRTRPSTTDQRVLDALALAQRQEAKALEGGSP